MLTQNNVIVNVAGAVTDHFKEINTADQISHTYPKELWSGWGGTRKREKRGEGGGGEGRREE